MRNNGITIILLLRFFCIRVIWLYRVSLYRQASCVWHQLIDSLKSVVRPHMVLSILYIHAFSRLFILIWLWKRKNIHPWMWLIVIMCCFVIKKGAKPGWNNDDVAVKYKSDGIKQNVNVIRLYRWIIRQTLTFCKLYAVNNTVPIYKILSQWNAHMRHIYMLWIVFNKNIFIRQVFCCIFAYGFKI